MNEPPAVRRFAFFFNLSGDISTFSRYDMIHQVVWVVAGLVKRWLGWVDVLIVKRWPVFQNLRWAEIFFKCTYVTGNFIRGEGSSYNRASKLVERQNTQIESSVLTLWKKGKRWCK